MSVNFDDDFPLSEEESEEEMEHLQPPSGHLLRRDLQQNHDMASPLTRGREELPIIVDDSDYGSDLEMAPLIRTSPPTIHDYHVLEQMGQAIQQEIRSQLQPRAGDGDSNTARSSGNIAVREEIFSDMSDASSSREAVPPSLLREEPRPVVQVEDPSPVSDPRDSQRQVSPPALWIPEGMSRGVFSSESSEDEEDDEELLDTNPLPVTGPNLAPVTKAADKPDVSTTNESDTDQQAAEVNEPEEEQVECQICLSEIEHRTGHAIVSTGDHQKNK